jgi:hypothetical protein
MALPHLLGLAAPVAVVEKWMKRISYSGYRFPPEIIHQAIWLYLRFTLSFRDVEDLLAERGVAVFYETIRRWVIHFGPMIAAALRKRRPKPYTTWHLDEVYLNRRTLGLSMACGRFPGRGAGRLRPDEAEQVGSAEIDAQTS